MPVNDHQTNSPTPAFSSNLMTTYYKAQHKEQFVNKVIYKRFDLGCVATLPCGHCSCRLYSSARQWPSHWSRTIENLWFKRYTFFHVWLVNFVYCLRMCHKCHSIIVKFKCKNLLNSGFDSFIWHDMTWWSLSTKNVAIIYINKSPVGSRSHGIFKSGSVGI
jgi:hypothetical protein